MALEPFAVAAALHAINEMKCSHKLPNGTVVQVRTVFVGKKGNVGSFMWRQLLPHVFAALSQQGSDVTVRGGDVYQFGVFTGNSMRTLYGFESLRSSRMWGFDSFRGLPDEDLKHSTHTTAFQPGMFSSDPRSEKLARELPNAKFVAGFYNESLRQPGLVRRLGLAPARYVDVDVDLYSSTRDLLTFLFRHRLMVPGSVIGYDDWWSHACATNADAQLGPLSQGEGLAHVEAAREFNVSFACLAGGCRRASQPCNAFGAIFLVVSIGQQPDPGVDMTADDVAEWKKRDRSCVYVRTRTRDKLVLVRGGTR